MEVRFLVPARADASHRRGHSLDSPGNRAAHCTLRTTYLASSSLPCPRKNCSLAKNDPGATGNTRYREYYCTLIYYEVLLEFNLVSY